MVIRGWLATVGGLLPLVGAVLVSRAFGRDSDSATDTQRRTITPASVQILAPGMAAMRPLDR